MSREKSLKAAMTPLVVLNQAVLTRDRFQVESDKFVMMEW